MKKLIKPASLLFYLLTIIVFFFIGIYFAKMIGAGKGQMLAGGAIVLFYGVVSAGLAFISSLFAAFNLKHSTIIKCNKILGILSLLFIGWVTYENMTREKKEDAVKEYPKIPTQPMNNEQ